MNFVASVTAQVSSFKLYMVWIYMYFSDMLKTFHLGEIFLILSVEEDMGAGVSVVERSSRDREVLSSSLHWGTGDVVGKQR